MMSNSSPRSESTARPLRRKPKKEQDTTTTNHTNNKPNGTSHSHKQPQQPQQQQQQNGGQRHSPRNERHRPNNRQPIEAITQQHSQKHTTEQVSKRQPQQQEQPQPSPKLPQQLTTDFADFPEIEKHLQQLWNASFEQLRDTKTEGYGRPILYQDSSKAWGGDSKLSLLRTFNFSAELKKAYISKYSSFPRFTPKTEPPPPPGKTDARPAAEANGVSGGSKDGSFASETIHSTPTPESKNVHYNIHSHNPDPIYSDEQINKTGDDINSTTTQNGKPQPGAANDADKEEGGSEAEAAAEEETTAESATTNDDVAAANDDATAAEDSYDYGFTNDAYEEISDPHGAAEEQPTANPGDVIIDIGDTGDDVITTSAASKAPKAKKKPKKPKKKHVNTTQSIDDELDLLLAENNQQNNDVISNGHVSNGFVNTNHVSSNGGNNISIINSNNNNSNSPILAPGNKEAWNDFLGTLLPRPKTEVYRTTGTGTLQLENSSGGFQFSHESMHTTNPNVNFSPHLFSSAPKEFVRIFSSRFGKAVTPETTSVPVKWSSGEGMAAPRKFPMEVPFFLKEMFAVKNNRMSCANLKCSNVTTEDKPFKTCAKCNTAAYCSRECQKEDWVKRHKLTCKSNATATEEQRKAYAAQKLWATTHIRHIIYLHWYSRFGKGVVVMMSRDFLTAYFEDDPSAKDLYIFYMPMADILSDDCPIPALKKHQAEFTKSFANHDSDSQSIAAAAVDSTGFATPHIDEVKVIQLKLSKRSCKEHDLQSVDAISVDSHNHATLYTFH